MRKFFFFSLISLLFSCSGNNEKRYFDTRQGDGVKYDLLLIGDGDSSPRKGEIVHLSMDIRSKDQLLFTSASAFTQGRFNIKIDKDFQEKGFYELLCDLKEGDSIQGYIDAGIMEKEFPYLLLPNEVHNREAVQVNIRLHDIFSRERDGSNWLEKANQKNKELLSKAEYQEHILLSKYLKVNEIDPFEDYFNGVYLKIEKLGNSREVKKDDRLTVVYKGWNLKGKIVDYNPEGLEIIYGEGQLIRGLEIALKALQKGGKAKVVIPSHLAFGKIGSINGAVGPFTTLIYEVEVLDHIQN